MRRSILFVALGIVVLGLSLQAAAYAVEGMGIGAQIPTGRTLLWKVWLSPSFAVEPYVDLSHVSNDDYDETRFGFGMSAYSYTAANKKVSPFFGVKFGVDVHSNEDSETTVLIAPVLGAEYFVTQNVGIGADVSVNMAFGSLRIDTRSGMFAHYYF